MKWSIYKPIVLGLAATILIVPLPGVGPTVIRLVAAGMVLMVFFGVAIND